MWRMNHEFLEAKMFLCTQIMDEARHSEVFRKRALANGGGLLQSRGGTETLLRTIPEAKTYTQARAPWWLSVGHQTCRPLWRCCSPVVPTRSRRSASRSSNGWLATSSPRISLGASGPASAGWSAPSSRSTSWGSTSERSKPRGLIMAAIDDLALYDQLAAAMNADPAHYELLGDLEIELAIVMRRSDGDAFRALLGFTGISCSTVAAISEGDETSADCWLEGDLTD
jgi:hypothetical protein